MPISDRPQPSAARRAWRRHLLTVAGVLAAVYAINFAYHGPSSIGTLGPSPRQLIQMPLYLLVAAPIMGFPVWFMAAMAAQVRTPGFPLGRARLLVAGFMAAIAALVPYFFIPPLLLLAILVLIQWRLLRPRSPWPRLVRVWGPRSLKDTYLWAIGGAMVLFALGVRDAWAAVGAVTGAGVGLTVRLRAIRRQLQQVGASGPDEVLLLRPFGFDDAPFVRQDLPFTLRLISSSDGVPFDVYIAQAAAKQVGPLVALGDPGDIGARAGAVRRYVSDEHWRDVFHELSESAQAIFVIAPEITNHLTWEFGQLLQRGLTPKLFLFTRPVPVDRAKAVFWIRHFRRLGELLLGARLDRWDTAPPWAEVQRLLAGLGYEVPADDPGPGAILGFDERGRATVVARGLYEPEDLMAAVAATSPNGAGDTAVRLDT